MMIRTHLSLVATLALSACAGPPSGGEPGELRVALSSRLGEVEYHLQDARLRIDGPAPREVSLDGPGTRSLSLPAGPHQLTLLDGWVLARGEPDDTVPVEAELLSDNPVSLFLSAGAVEKVSFRFALLDGQQIESGDGQLEVGFELVDGGAADPEVGDPCVRALRLSEVDYDQEGTDDGEFVELTNGGTCPASLEGVALELVNGSNGSAYARVDLAPLGTLPAGARAVVGDEAILAQLGAEVSALPLPGSGLQNGPDSVRLVHGERTLDALGYGEGAPVVEGAAGPEDPGANSVGRCPDGFDTDDNARDFSAQPPTPGAENAC